MSSHKSEEKFNGDSRAEKKKKKARNSIKEERDEETEIILGILGKKQVGAVILWEMRRKTEKANGSQAK